jgi:hypothetical protein
VRSQSPYYRFLENEQVTISELVRSISDHCTQQVEGRHVLAISDPSEINLQSHVGRLKAESVGVVGNNRDVGSLVQRTLRRPRCDCIRFCIHPTLALDAESEFPLGLSNIQLWTRALERPNKTTRKYKTLPIEEKEPYKWLASAERSHRCFDVGDAKLVTYIGDREADLYEESATVPDQLKHVLVRVRTDRCLLELTETLFIVPKLYLVCLP